MHALHKINELNSVMREDAAILFPLGSRIIILNIIMIIFVNVLILSA